jgi:hypothetical protein
MKKVIIATAFALYALPLYAVDTPPASAKPGPNFEQHKADVIKKIDAVIAYRQEEKACVQAAKTHAELKACRDKFKAELQEMKQKK